MSLAPKVQAWGSQSGSIMFLLMPVILKGITTTVGAVILGTLSLDASRIEPKYSNYCSRNKIFMGNKTSVPVITKSLL
jgi:hypothetical protein